ncbi:MAG: 50S ribosomal protein L17 [Deltaproteobacteria bacterium]|nr:50S ribosomal protein L17 [Deltaproteobacteria bacterium]
MRHRKAGRKLNRTSSHRWAMVRNMVTSLFEHEKIQTTDAKAKELRRLAEKMITLAKRGDLHARRLANAVIRNKTVSRKLFDELAPRYSDRQGGYLRIIKLGYRLGDNAPISVVELLASGDKKKKKQKAKKPMTSEGKSPAEAAPVQIKDEKEPITSP